MSALTLSEIHIYPIKSLGGISLSMAQTEQRGLQYDRRWMLVDQAGHFLTQRTHPNMALLQVSLKENGLEITHRTQLLSPLHIPFASTGTKHLQVVVWDDTCKALAVSKEVDQWFSEALQLSCRLVYMPGDSDRPVDTRYATHQEQVSFADAFPFLLIGQASLDDLNGRMKQPLPMNRFRPNLVFSGGEPFEEDSWKKFRVGEMVFYGVKPCARCILTTVDQVTAQKGKEPLATLATYRQKNNKIYFGQNLLQESAGILKVGDQIEVLERAYSSVN